MGGAVVEYRDKNGVQLVRKYGSSEYRASYLVMDWNGAVMGLFYDKLSALEFMASLG